ncbi:hypothetical protein Tco_0331229 [Tanacetum coccineum]
MMFVFRFNGPIKIEKDFVLEKLKSLIQAFVEEDSSSSYVQDSLNCEKIHGCGHMRIGLAVYPSSSPSLDFQEICSSSDPYVGTSGTPGVEDL